MKTLIAVIGSADAEKPAYDIAYQTGREIIKAGFTLLCGGLSGVMEAASKGAYRETGKDSGRIIGILPGTSKSDANTYIDIAIPTGIGYSRNMIVACASDAVIAIAGGSGTLSEIAMAWQYGKPIVVIEGIDGVSSSLAGRYLDNRRKDHIFGARNAREAIATIKRLLAKQSSKS